MNVSPFDRNETHLDGALLEALASGAARVDECAHAQEHLNECARCRAELGAMSKENAGLSEFFRAEGSELLRRAEASHVQLSRKAYVLAGVAALAASVVLVAALALMKDNAPVHPRDTRGVVAEENPAPKPQQTPLPAPTPKVPDPVVTPPSVPAPPSAVPTPMPVEVPRAPVAGEAVTYQGKTAEEWARLLKDGTDGGTRDKARHALSRIGAEALPLMLKMMREGTPSEKKEAGFVLAALDDKSAVPDMAKLLDDPNWEVRFQAVQMLQKHVPDDDRAVTSLQKALKDRDKAVSEAAEEALAPLKAKKAEIDTKADALLAEGKTQMQQANYAAAIQCFQEALKLNPASVDARAALDQAMAYRAKVMQQDDQVARMLDESQALIKDGKLAEAQKLLERVLEVRPRDKQTLDLCDKIKLAIVRQEEAKRKLRRDTAGEGDLPGSETPAARAPKPKRPPDNAGEGDLPGEEKR